MVALTIACEAVAMFRNAAERKSEPKLASRAAAIDSRVVFVPFQHGRCVFASTSLR